MLQFTYVQEIDMSRGIDQDSSPSTLRQGYVEDAVDVDIEGISFEKRRGFERLAGDVPLVAQAISVTSGEVTLTFDSTVDFTDAAGMPVILQGMIDYGTSYVSEDEYFSTCVMGGLNILPLGSDQTYTVDMTLELGISSVDIPMWIVSEDTDTNIDVDEFEVNPSNMQVNLLYSSDDDINVRFATPIQMDNTYASADFSSVDALTCAGATISAATYNLSTLLIPAFYKMSSATEYFKFLPDEMTIDVSGDITVSFNAPSADKFKIILIEGDYVEGVAATGTTQTQVVIPDAQSPYLMAACYVEDLTNPAAPVLRLVLPDSIAYSSGSHIITFDHNVASDLGNYRVIYTYGRTPTNKLILTGSTLADLPSTTACSLALTGISQDLLPVKSHVTYVGDYPDKAEALMATGGMLFRTASPSITINVDIAGRIATDTYIGPTFSKACYARTAGCISSDDASVAGFLPVLSTSYLGSNVHRITVGAVTYAVTGGTLSSILVGAYLTIQGSNVGKLDGTHLIQAAGAIDTDSFYIDIVNTAVTSSRWDDADSGAICGVFSDTISFLGAITLPAAEGDTIILTDTCSVTIQSIQAGSIVVTGVEEKINLYLGQRIGVTGPFTQLDFTNGSILPGDVISYGDFRTRVESALPTSITLREPIQVTDGRVTFDVPSRWQLVRTPDAFIGERPLPTSEIVTSQLLRGSLLFNVSRKYDGDKIYAAGLPRTQLHAALSVEEGSGIAISTKICPIDNGVAGFSGTTDIPVPANDINILSIGDQVVIRKTVVAGTVLQVDPEDVYTVVDILTASNKVKLDRSFTALGSGIETYEMATFVTLRYFARLAITDRLGSKSVSASLGANDLAVRLSKSSAVHLRFHYMLSDVEMIDYSNCSIEIFRRRETSDSLTDFYLIGSIPLTERVASGVDYIDFTDSVPQIVAERSDNKDTIVDPVPGSFGTNRYRQPIASVVASSNNQLVCGDYYGETYTKILIDGTAVYSDYQGEDFVVDGTSFHITSSSFADITNISSVADTSFTVTVASTTGISAGDYIFIGRDSSLSVGDRPTFLGWWLVGSVDINGTDFTVLFGDSPSVVTPADEDRLKIWHVAGKIPLVHDLAYANNGQSIGKDDSDKIGLPLHLSQAINAILGPSGVYAHAGQDFPSGTLELTGNATSITVPAVTGARIYCNGSLTTNIATTSITRYGSRTAASIKEYPEVFQDIEADSGTSLPLIQDYSPDDGDVITGAVAFFALATFGAAQQSSVLLVFKSKSAYVVDSQVKYSGGSDFFKQIDTRGIGCAAKNSIINSADGVFFVSDSLIYMISRQFSLEMVGINLSGFWRRGEVSADQLSEACAVSSAFTRKLLFTVPTTDDLGNTTFVYNIPNATQTLGGWTRYSNLNANLWAEYAKLPIFATSLGYVGIMRNDKTSDDFQDAGALIKPTITFRAIDGGIPSFQKFLKFVSLVAGSEYNYDVGDITMSVSNNFSTNFVDMDQFVLRGSENTALNGLGDISRNRLQLTSFSPQEPKAGWYQLKMTVNDAPSFSGLTVSRVIYKLAALRTRADVQAAETTSG